MSNVKLLWIEGEDAEEFADLIGTTGTIEKRHPQGLRYMPNGHNDWLVMAGDKIEERDGRLRVKTKLGNTFVFKH